MKKFMRIGVIFLCAAVVLTIVGFVPAVFVQAASADTAIPKIHLAASAKQVQAGETFEVGIWLQNFNGNYSSIEGFQVRLKYDPAFIIPVDESGEFNTEAIFSKTVQPNTYANTIGKQGTIEFAQSLPPKSVTGHFTGNGKLGTITFKALKDGKTTITHEKSIVIMPGNPGVNIKHAYNNVTIVIGSHPVEDDKIEIIGDEPKTKKAKMSSDEILRMFKDYEEIQKLTWAKEGVAKLADLKVVNGTPEGRFEPARNMTRAEFAKVAVIGLGLDMKQQANPSFVDIKKNDWFYDYVETAASYDLIKGYDMNGERQFRPEAPISRAEIAAILSRALIQIKGKSMTENTNNPFADVEITHWAIHEIVHLYQTGVIKGRSANTFAPKEFATRAEISVMIGRLLDISK